MVDLSSNDALGSALARVRLHGSVFSRSEIRAPWGVGSGPLPHAVCVVIVEGEAHLALGGRHRAQRTLRAGDVVLVRAGIPLTLRDSPSSPVVSLERFALSQGRRRGGRITRLVCTSLELDAVGKDLLGSALPAVVQLSSLDAGPATRALVDALTTEVTHPSAGTEVMVTRLSELLFLQCLRHCIEQGTVTAGWLQGLRHPAMAKVLARIHVDPGREWTVESLARIAGMSRSVFASTFRKTVGETPLGYLTAWRMRHAARLLEDGTESLKAVATAVGYGSDEAFSRAFREWSGMPPGRFRSKVSASSV